MTNEPEGSEATAQPGERLEWRVWPAAQKPVLSVVVGVFCLVLAAVAIATFGSAWYGFITLLVLGLTLAPHFFPTTYVLDGVRVVSRGGGGNAERKWGAFRVALDLGDRILLSPLTDTTRWFARRRSVVLRLEANRDEVLAFVARHVPVRQGQTIG